MPSSVTGKWVFVWYTISGGQGFRKGFWSVDGIITPTVTRHNKSGEPCQWNCKIKGSLKWSPPVHLHLSQVHVKRGFHLHQSFYFHNLKYFFTLVWILLCKEASGYSKSHNLQSLFQMNVVGCSVSSYRIIRGIFLLLGYNLPSKILKITEPMILQFPFQGYLK